MKMESSLSLINLNGDSIPLLAFCFVDIDGARCVADFEPRRVLLAESSDPQYYQLVDEEGFEYARVRKREDWIEAALHTGLFVLSMRTPLPTQDLVGGRILMIAFPFGTVIQDSGTFAARSADLEELEHSRDLTDRLQDLASQALKRLPANISWSN